MTDLDRAITFWEEELDAFRAEGAETAEMREYDRAVLKAARAWSVVSKKIPEGFGGETTLPQQRVNEGIIYDAVREAMGCVK